MTDTTPSVKRYARYGGMMHKSSDGNYVPYSDYAALSAQAARMREALEKLLEDYEQWISEGTIVALAGTRSDRALTLARAAIKEVKHGS